MEYKKELDDIFYNKNFLMKSLPKFYHKIKSMNLNIPYKVAKFYYENQAITQIFKPPHHEREIKYKPIISYKPFERVYIDTMYLIYPKQTLAIVTIYDLFSKYGDARSIAIKAGAKNISSEKTREAFSEMLETIHGLGYEVNTVYSDNGNEYIKNFDSFLTKKHIVHIFGNVDDKRMTSPIERFNGTLRLSIEKYKATYGRVSRSVLPAIIDAYNNSVHSVGYTPMDILKSENIQKIVKENYVKKSKQYYEKDVMIVYCNM